MTDSPTGEMEEKKKKHTKARKVPAVLRTMWKTIKHSIQSPKSKVCRVVPEQDPSQVHPDTFGVEPTDDFLAKVTMTPGLESFFRQCEVGERLSWGRENDRYYKGTRKSDGVTVKFPSNLVSLDQILMIVLLVYRAFSTSSSHYVLLSKPLSRWSADDVTLWVEHLRVWTNQYKQTFLREQINGRNYNGLKATQSEINCK